MINVLAVADFFLPGFKAGGPVRTLLNMSKILHDSVVFGFVTRDHDLGESERYDGVQVGRWAEYPYGKVYCSRAGAFGRTAVEQALSTSHFDVIYLNSFFSFRGSIAISLRNWRRSFHQPILLAPRGEFSTGALALKSGRKRFFIRLSRLLGVYRQIYWHASSEVERKDILQNFPQAAPRIFVAADPVERNVEPVIKSTQKEPGHVRLVFVSRISPMKNIAGLLEILSGVNCKVSLDIYGPIEDPEYWEQCRLKMSALPDNIEVKYLGQLTPSQVSRAFSEGDLFAFPTHGENFGHVIFEALNASCPVLVSDQTPWQPDETSALTRLPLEAVSSWRQCIESVARLSAADQEERRTHARRYAQRYAASGTALRDNLQMFEQVARRVQKELSI